MKTEAADYVLVGGHEENGYWVGGTKVPIKKFQSDENAALRTQVAELTRERDQARAVISHANNSIYGSDGYFVEDGDVHALAHRIETLKAQSNGDYHRAEQAEALNLRLREALEKQAVEPLYGAGNFVPGGRPDGWHCRVCNDRSWDREPLKHKPDCLLHTPDTDTTTPKDTK